MNTTPKSQSRTTPVVSRKIQQAIELFNDAGKRIEGQYSTLSREVRRLTQELEASNLELRRNLLEKDKMQAILISTLQSLTIGVLAVGHDGIIIIANPTACWLLEREVNQIASHNIDDLLPELHDRDQILNTLQSTGGSQYHTTWHVRRNESHDRSIDVGVIRALPPCDQHLSGLVLFEDVSEMRRLEQQSSVHNRLTGMGEIAINLAHEIRNPLGSISLFATALAKELEDDESLSPISEQIVNGVKSLEHIVANTLEFSRPRRLSFSRINLVDLLLDTLVYVEHPVIQKNIRIQFDHDLIPEAWITGDPEQLRRVFLNLVINAIQAMFEDGVLKINLIPDGHEGWTVHLEDDGVGIPEEYIKRIFDPFFTTHDKGSGIGLAVVHTILTAHHAFFDVKSREAEGTRVQITFPAPEIFPGTGSLS
jgi:nitrogen fixation/metabolism regulation signal transduction histidine kinase